MASKEEGKAVKKPLPMETVYMKLPKWLVNAAMQEGLSQGTSQSVVLRRWLEMGTPVPKEQRR